MADLIIRGMEMPKEGNWKTIRIYPDGTCAVPNWQGDCKVMPYIAAPLPKGHGKIIDIEDVKSKKFHIKGQAEMYSAYNIGWNDALDAVCMNASIIIPSEGGNSDDNP